jgi:UrcA family protein
MSIAIRRNKIFGSSTVIAALAAATITAVTFASLSTPAHAASQSDIAPSVVVHYEDLNLSTDAGTKALYLRIAAAARQVCPDTYSRELARVAMGKKCQDAAIGKAVNDVHSPQLAAIHAVRTQRG